MITITMERYDDRTQGVSVEEYLRGQLTDDEMFYAIGWDEPHYPVPAISYWASFDKKHFPLQHLMDLMYTKEIQDYYGCGPIDI